MADDLNYSDVVNLYSNGEMSKEDLQHWGISNGVYGKEAKLTQDYNGFDEDGNLVTPDYLEHKAGNLWDKFWNIFTGDLDRENNRIDAFNTKLADTYNQAKATKEGQIQQEREDTAYQRTLKDLEAAGINPIVWLATRGLNLAGSSSFDFPETSFTGKNSEQAKGLLGIIARILAALS